VAATYGYCSEARNTNALSDPYVKALRWATDRIGREGIVAFVTNNNFVHGRAFDGMRVELAREFSSILHIDMKGDARTSGEERKKQSGNVFDDKIKVGVGITLLIKRQNASASEGVRVYSVPDYMNSEDKRAELARFDSFANVPLHAAPGTVRQPWLGSSGAPEFDSLVPLLGEQGVFKWQTNGAKTNRDLWVYGENRERLMARVQETIGSFNSAIIQFSNSRLRVPSEQIFSEVIPWSETLKRRLTSKRELTFDETLIRVAQYRPFDRRFIYFDPILIERRYGIPKVFPANGSSNLSFAISETGHRSPFATLMVGEIPDVHLCGSDAYSCFSYFEYNDDGCIGRENITDWALAEFRAYYQDKSITKWDIFYYTYALLHHPDYRERYAANLKRELPRIPYAPDFKAFAKAGERLADLHVNYEKQPEYPLEKIENPKAKGWSWKVEKMRLGRDKTSVAYNEHLTLSGIPQEAFEYRLGNRSALDWVIDQYQVSTDKRSGITNDPNREDDPEYIVRLIGQVVYVSVETVKIVKALPGLGLPEQAEKAKA
jgi:predicted helicase